MIQQEKRIKIAEACGWIDIYRGSRKGNRTPEGNTLWGTKDAPSINYGREYVIVPDYFNDLNAMQFAEKVLTENVTYMQRHAFNNYAYRLIEMCKHQCNAVSAPAAERAEAFGKTLNLW
jgi:hypothetical protein